MNLGSRLALLLAALLLSSVAISATTAYSTLYKSFEAEHRRQNSLLAGDVKDALAQARDPRDLVLQYSDDPSLAQLRIQLPSGGVFELPQVKGRVLPSTVVTLPVSDDGGEILVSSNDGLVRREALQALRAQLLSFVPVTLLFFIASLLMLRSILKPLYQIEMVTDRLLAQLKGDGSDFDFREIELLESQGMPSAGLARTLLTTGSQLNQTLKDLETVQAKGKKVEAELRLAGQIQKSLLPAESLTHQNFAVEAALTPAQEVGGDLYVYFWVKDSLFFAVGDVTGKGMPAALFMGATLSLLRGCIKGERSLGEDLAEVNDILSADNSEMYFVTFFCGLLEPGTGRVTYVNAGHPSPLLRKTDGSFQELPLTSGTALGVSTGMVYDQEQITLKKAEMLIVFSDGLGEMNNAEGALFEDHLPSSIPTSSGRETIDFLFRSVREFAGSEQLEDDTTLLCLEYKG